mgnify:CR=1 FL=1
MITLMTKSSMMSHSLDRRRPLLLSLTYDVEPKVNHEESTIAKLTKSLSPDIVAQLNRSVHFPRLLVHIEMGNVDLATDDFNFMRKAGMFGHHGQAEDMIEFIDGFREK